MVDYGSMTHHKAIGIGFCGQHLRRPLSDVQFLLNGYVLLLVSMLGFMDQSTELTRLHMPSYSE